MFVKLNIDFPFFILTKYIFCFLYVTYIPGFLLLRVFKIHNLNNSELILYSIGLSITSLMFIGLITNILGASFFFPPITNDILIIALTIFIFMLCLISYFNEKNFSEKIEYVNLSLQKILLIPLFLSLSIVGTYFLYYYNVNILLLILYFAIIQSNIISFYFILFESL
jgi:uncharacterized membrane protein